MTKTSKALSEHSLTDTLRDGIVIVDPSRQIVYANPAARQILGLTDQAMKRLPNIYEAAQTARLDCDNQVVEKCLVTAFKGQPTSCQFTRQHNQQVQYFEALLSPYQPGGETTKSIAIAFHDVTPLYLEKTS
jgi:PAS domain S-box-containing protein